MVFYNNLAKLDLHGADRDYARIRVNEFIDDLRKEKKDSFVIVHGKGLGIVKRSVHETLKKNKYVKDYKLDNFNIGCTIVHLKEGEE